MIFFHLGLGVLLLVSGSVSHRIKKLDVGKYISLVPIDLMGKCSSKGCFPRV